MAFLKNLNVRKVSFVRRGANKRKFLLLKSMEEPNDGDQNKQKEEIKMQELVKTKVMEILKSEQDPTKVVALLKSDKEIESLKLSDEDFTEVQNSVEFLKALHSSGSNNDADKKKEEEKKAAEEKAEAVRKAAENGNPQLSEVVKQLATMTKAMETSNEQNKTLAEELAKQKKDIAHRDIIKWITINCPYLPADVQKTADEILILQETSESAAQIMKDSLQRASAALENSDAFNEIGNGSDGQIGPKIPGSELLQEINKELAAVKKSGEKVDEPAIIRGIVNGGGRRNYLAYRNQVIQRAKLAGLDPSLLQSLL